MTQEQTQQTAPEQSDTQEAGSLDAAALAFEKREAPEQSDETEATGDTEAQSDEQNAEADEADPDDATDAELEEVELEGFRLAVPKEQAEAIRKATLRQADYSRKMNEVSAKDKEAASKLEHAERLTAGIEKYAEARAHVTMLEQQIKQYEAIDWQKLRQEDPANYAAHATDLQTLRINHAQAQNAARAVTGEVDQARNATFAKERQAMTAALAKAFPDWNKASDELCAYAETQGVKVETLARLTDPAMVLALDKARKYDALQQGKAALKARVQDAPKVIKPGAVRKAADPKSDAMGRLRKSNSLDDATSAFLARMN